MQDKLYPLTSKDVEAVGKARVSRDLPSNVKWWLYGGLVVCLVGFLFGAMGGNAWGSVGIVAVGAGCIWYSSMLIDKIRKRVIRQLKEEWKETERKSE